MNMIQKFGWFAVVYFWTWLSSPTMAQFSRHPATLAGSFGVWRSFLWAQKSYCSHRIPGFSTSSFRFQQDSCMSRRFPRGSGNVSRMCPRVFFIFLFQVVSLVCTTRLNHWRLETLESPILGTMKIWNPGFFDSWNLSDQNLPMNLANSNLRPSFDGPEISDKIRTGFFIGILYWASEMPINMKHTSRTAQIGGKSFKDRTP